MELGYIFLIAGASLVGLIILLLIFGRVAASRKGISNLKKRVASIKKDTQNETKPGEPSQDYKVDLERPQKSKGAIITDYDEFDDDDKKSIVTNNESVANFEEEAPKRKTFEEIMRNREQRRMQNYEQEDFELTDEFEDDFDKFREQHSSYTSYQKDNELISKIKDMSPQARKILFSNLFKRIDHD